MHAKQRLYWDKDKTTLVADGPKAAFLYAAVGDIIPDSIVQRFGLVDGMLPASGAKSRKADEDKSRKPGDDKQGKPGDDKGPKPDDLTQVKGIGPATARKLAGAGVTTFRALAQAGGGERSPELNAIGSPDEWKAWAEQALALAGPSSSLAAPAGGGLKITKADSNKN